MCRKRFTYMNKDLSKLSKLDRVLVSMDFMSLWPNEVLTALDRGMSDHCPIVLQCASLDYGPLPFRFFNSWLKNPHFITIVTQAIQYFQRNDLPPDKRLAIKLKTIKETIKAWRLVENEKEHGEFISWQSELQMLELKAETTLLTNDEIKKHGDLMMKTTLHQDKKTMDFKQKSRSRWAIDGDENSTFFHGLFKAHSSTNRINGMLINGVWTSIPGDIKQNAFNFFKSKFHEPEPLKPMITDPAFAKLNNMEKSSLVARFSMEEIRAAVWECGNDKSPAQTVLPLASSNSFGTY